MRKLIISGVLVVLALSGFLIACGGGGGGGGGGSVAISASLDSSYTVAYAPTFLDNLKGIFFAPDAMALASGTTVDKVVAIPTWRGAYGPANMLEMKTATIDRSGSFTLNLDTGYEWVLLLVNTAASSKAEKVAGYVAATVDDNNTLIAFAGSKMASNLSLGTLTKSAGEAKSSTSGMENAAAFDLSLDQLISLGKSDDGYKHLINLYLLIMIL